MAAAGLADTTKADGNDCEVTDGCADTAGLSLTGGVDYTTAFFHRGFAVQEGGLILQPFLTASKTWRPCAEVTVSPYLTLWNSIQTTGKEASVGESLMTGAMNTEGGWHLGEVMGGVFTTYGSLTLDCNYTLYTYPFGDFTSAHEMGTKAGYDLLAPWKDSVASGGGSLRASAAIYYGSLDQIGMGKGFSSWALSRRTSGWSPTPSWSSAFRCSWE